MRERQIRMPADDGHQIFVRIWDTPHSQPAAVIQISHGMAEHSARYSALAALLTAAGFTVIAHDHRGHGHSQDDGIPGHFADRNGWSRVLNDMDLVCSYVQQTYPGLPLFLLGHSMGSFILQHYLICSQVRCQGVILSGSNYSHPVKYLAAMPIAQLERLRQGSRGKSPLIAKLSFGSFNDEFQPARTAFDWLSSCPDTVDEYINDPKCGFDCTNQLWIDLLGGLFFISQPQNLRRIPDTSFLILGGTMDPVSRQSKGLQELAERLKATGRHQIALNLYPQGRHEMFQETNRDEVFADVLKWLNQQFS